MSDFISGACVFKLAYMCNVYLGSWVDFKLHRYILNIWCCVAFVRLKLCLVRFWYSSNEQIIRCWLEMDWSFTFTMAAFYEVIIFASSTYDIFPIHWTLSFGISSSTVITYQLLRVCLTVSNFCVVYRATLNDMESQGVIRRVDEPIQWVNSLVIVEKPKSRKLRTCLDPRHLNKAIQREHFQLPILEDNTTWLAGAQMFLKLDANHGYGQIPLVVNPLSYFTR